MTPRAAATALDKMPSRRKHEANTQEREVNPQADFCSEDDANEASLKAVAASACAKKSGSKTDHRIAARCHDDAATAYKAAAVDKDTPAANRGEHFAMASSHRGKAKEHRAAMATFSTTTGDNMDDLVHFEFALPAANAKPAGNRYKIVPAPLLFKEGKYPDKGFEITAAEIKDAVAAFKGPLAFDIEHKPSVLDGKLGGLLSVAMNPDQTSFGGLAAFPNYLDPAIPPAERKLSLTWNRGLDGKPKRIQGCAIVRTPRITGAGLADFSEGDSALLVNFMADEAANGALPDAPDDSSDTSSALQGKALFQKIYDLLDAAEDASDDTLYSPLYTKTIDKMKTMAVAAGAEEDDDGDDATMTAEKRAAKKAATDAASFSEREKAMQAENQRLKADAERLRADRLKKIDEDAANFATSECLALRAYPAEWKTIVQLYKDVARNDEASFAAGREANLLISLRTTYAAKPRHNLTEEQVQQQLHALTTLPSASANSDFSVPERPTKEGQPVSEERIAKLLSGSRLGQHILAERAAKK